MEAGFRIVPARREHLRAVSAIEHAAATLFPREDLPEHLRHRVTSREVLDEARADGRLWIALDRGQRPAGFALAEALATEAWLDEVDVHPLYMRRGIGTRLVETAVEWARQQGHAALFLLTFRHLPWNAAFYERLGFEQLRNDALGPALLHILEEERRAGIDVAKRVGMRRWIGRG